MTLPLPEFYDPKEVGSVYRVDYAELSALAFDCRQTYNLQPASADRQKTWLLLVDVQNTFCIPGFELFVGGRSGNGAVEDNRRLTEFIYRHLDSLTHITATLDTHFSQQVFFPVFFVDSSGNHPTPYTNIYLDDLSSGKWSFNPALAPRFGISPAYGQKMMLHYAETLLQTGKYALTIWPYHAMLGGIGHAMVSAVEEAIFYHSLARLDQPDFELKGEQPFTEFYSAVGPEVLIGPRGESLGARNPKFLQQLQQVDRLLIAGQAKSHCVAWTVSDLLDDLQATDPALAQKIFLLEDCSSPVVVPGVLDHSEAADAAYARFAQAGIRIVRAADSQAWM
jgi:nicotinamidase-related amidase